MPARGGRRRFVGGGQRRFYQREQGGALMRIGQDRREVVERVLEPRVVDSAVSVDQTDGLDER